ncbi:hypothetical protein IFR04_011298 [Cadophora malorum]|uniref:Uncharacterized protein n=1 Tax=Cadophora malorum TaxID=108018 RepID=A0A8H7TB43_9HELO|nr:hypothetical protein IFR04_011298 [Cadophora malorum]
MPPDVVQGVFKFIQWQDLYHREKPFQVLTQIPPDAENQRSHNLIFEEVEVAVKDVRSLAIPPKLDTYGFMYREHPLTFADFQSRQAVEKYYLPEVERLMRAESPAGVLNRVMLQLKENAPQLLKQRVRVINIWRPIVDVIGDWALALCDGRTANPEDFIETDHVRRHYTGSSMYLQKRPGQEFYYLSRQGKDDVLFLKIFDSKKKGIGAPCEIKSVATRIYSNINIRIQKDPSSMPLIDPTHPTAQPAQDRENSPTRSENNLSDSGSEDEDTKNWVEQTLAKNQKDGRDQPWKKTFKAEGALENIDNTMEDGEDLVVVPAPKMPSAGEATIYEQQSLSG